MKNAIIIGAGELGSRHLQGMLKCEELMQVFVLDISPEALAKAKSRAAEIEHLHTVHYVEEFALLPAYFDVAIIASNANIREHLVIELLKRSAVKFLILEKVLFQELDAYKRIEQLFTSKVQKVWVNHPRRMFPHYQFIKNELTDQLNEGITFQCAGGNWGLGCNALHLLDIFSYVANSTLQNINFSFLDPKILTSKRVGFVDFTGIINANLKNGAAIQIISFRGERTPLTVSVMSSKKRYLVQEGGTPQITTIALEGNFNMEINRIETLYQSSLTKKLLEDLFEKNDCDLPTFAEASINHTVFIKGLLEKYNEITGLNTSICPIT
jgi:hypothetical protein